MPTKKAPKSKKGRKAPATEFRLWIDAYKPSTIPMARLAEYMSQLAAMLGEQDAVHFVKLERGSTSIVHKVQSEALPKVRDRARAIRTGSAPRDAIRAYQTVNKMLREDNGVGVLKEDVDHVIIQFPGREETEEKYSGVKQRGSIDGEVIRVGGPHKWVPIMMESEGEPISGCWADRVVAKQLAQRLFEPVRLYGSGKWNRDAEGRWTVQEFVVDSFEALRDESLSDALTHLRALNVFADNSLADVERLRHGPREKQNGGS